MNTREMNKLIKHFDKYLNQSDSLVVHSTGLSLDQHIDTLLYAPSDAIPYWKLITMGASDYRMHIKKPCLGNRNEYIMFVDRSDNLRDEELLLRYVRYLLMVAHYPSLDHSSVTYGHSIEWEPKDGEEMVGAFLEMPQILKDPAVVRCKLSLTKTVACLQVVLLNKQEMDRLLKIGPEKFSYYLYPEDNPDCHFICELHRSERF